MPIKWRNVLMVAEYLNQVMKKDRCFRLLIFACVVTGQGPPVAREKIKKKWLDNEE